MTRRLEWQDKTKIIDLFFPTKKLSISESHSLLDFTATTKNSFSFEKVICSWSVHPLLSKMWSQSVFMIRFNASWLQPVFTVDRSLTARWCWDWLVLCMRSFGQVCTFIHRRKKDLAKSGQSLWSKKRWTQRTTDFHYPLCSMNLLTGTDHDLVQLAIY